LLQILDQPQDAAVLIRRKSLEIDMPCPKTISDFEKMADAFRRYVEAGNPLSPSDLADAAAVTKT
jgi:hypothetical protein